MADDESQPSEGSHKEKERFRIPHSTFRIRHSRPEVLRGRPRRGHWTPVEKCTHLLVWANQTRIGTSGPNHQREVIGKEDVLMTCADDDPKAYG
jgi:hypothetical protein